MSHPLREVTNMSINIAATNPAKAKTLTLARIEDNIVLNHQAINFGNSIPGSIHQRKLSITMLKPQQSLRLITIHIICQDMLLNELPQYIFGVRKEKSLQYFDEYKFKAAQKGTYNFVIGVKTPILEDYTVAAKLEVKAEGMLGTLLIDLKLQAKMPNIRCCKELFYQDNLRVIKLSAFKNRIKKQIKVGFKCTENLNFDLLAELLSLQEGGQELTVEPKSVKVGGKGSFVLSFFPNCPQDIGDSWYCIRRVLTLRLKDTSMYYHFPIELTFYPENKREIVD